MKHWLLGTVITISLLITHQSLAAGYYVDEQSALRLGDAFSGGSASSSDASAAFYGPASMMLVPDQLAVNVAILPVTSEFNGNAYVLDGNNTAIQGGNAKTSTTDVLPSLYLTRHLDPSLAVGVFLNAPYATGSKFGKTSKARYQAADSEITGIDLGASFAARINNQLTLGGGLIMQYIQAETGQAINTTALCLQAESLGDLGPLSCTQDLGVNPNDIGTSTTDGYFKMTGQNVSFGFQLGALIELSSNSRVGLNYRSQIRHSISGQATAHFPSDGFTEIAGLAGTLQAEGRVQLNTPETADLSYFHQFGQFALQASASWTNWQRFEQLKVTSQDPAIADFIAQPVNYQWTDTFRLALGTHYQWNNKLTLRAGFAYDQTPIKDEFVKADFGFDDYKALSFGSSYQINPQLMLDAGLQHTLKQSRNINNLDHSSGSWLQGKVSTEVTTVALGLRWLL